MFTDEIIRELEEENIFVKHRTWIISLDYSKREVAYVMGKDYFRAFQQYLSHLNSKKNAGFSAISIHFRAYIMAQKMFRKIFRTIMRQIRLHGKRAIENNPLPPQQGSSSNPLQNKSV